jgi:hypothetical protein
MHIEYIPHIEYLGSGVLVHPGPIKSEGDLLWILKSQHDSYLKSFTLVFETEPMT